MAAKKKTTPKGVSFSHAEIRVILDAVERIDPFEFDEGSPAVKARKSIIRKTIAALKAEKFEGVTHVPKVGGFPPSGLLQLLDSYSTTRSRPDEALVVSKLANLVITADHVWEYINWQEAVLNRIRSSHPKSGTMSIKVGVLSYVLHREIWNVNPKVRTNPSFWTVNEASFGGDEGFEFSDQFWCKTSSVYAKQIHSVSLHVAPSNPLHSGEKVAMFEPTVKTVKLVHLHELMAESEERQGGVPIHSIPEMEVIIGKLKLLAEKIKDKPLALKFHQLYED
jgi:hypothetical protein